MNWKFAMLATALMSNAVYAQTTLETRAEKAGIKRCLPTISRVSKFLVEDSQHASYDTNSKDSPDTRPFFSRIVKSYSDGDSQIIVTFSPSAGGECDWTYWESMLFEEPCGVVREEVFNDFVYDRSLNATTIVLKSPISAVYVYLTPSGSNKACLAGKEESGYE
ncbi:hypothetical protein [Stenotrophomonas daejeonensis]|uniref:hypothetical protein n=1 Tax=Stenotrophomonas daejeonensis TaxID=659018 RepID=UPI00128F0653|nr:hypothetical protein [Stenotrophomonas daejeonensis]